MSEPARVYSGRLFEDFLNDQSNIEFEAVLVHGDLGCEHILCDNQRGVINGIIDWGEVSNGNSVDDFAAITVGLGRDLVEEVIISYIGTVDGEFWKRVRWYVKIFQYYDNIHGLKTDQDTLLQTGIRSVTTAAASQAHHSLGAASFTQAISRDVTAAHEYDEMSYSPTASCLHPTEKVPGWQHFYGETSRSNNRLQQVSSPRKGSRAAARRPHGAIIVLR